MTMRREIFAHTYSSPLGLMGMTSDGCRLTGLWFEGQRHAPAQLPSPAVSNLPEVFHQAQHWLDLYFGGKIPDFTPPLALESSAFRLAVWEVLRAIPYGQTMTYGQIARILAEKSGLSEMSAQAVGGAVGHNKISILIPCHRVVGRDQSLTGYAGGLERKKWLLELEKGNVRHSSAYGTYSNSSGKNL